MNEVAIRDLRLLESILGKSITNTILKTNNIDSKNEYKNVNVRKRNSGWLWNIFLKICVPFQARTGSISGKRRLSVGAIVYAFAMVLLCSFLNMYLLVIPSVRTMFFGCLWGGIFVVWLLPKVKAFHYLVKNKEYYFEVKKYGR